MTYSKAERKAAKLLRAKGWTVLEPTPSPVFTIDDGGTAGTFCANCRMYHAGPRCVAAWAPVYTPNTWGGATG